MGTSNSYSLDDIIKLTGSNSEGRFEPWFGAWPPEFRERLDKAEVDKDGWVRWGSYILFGFAVLWGVRASTGLIEIDSNTRVKTKLINIFHELGIVLRNKCTHNFDPFSRTMTF